MGILSHSVQHLDSAAFHAEEIAEPASAQRDDGLGCMRGLAVVILFNAAVVLLTVAAWGIWELLFK